MLQVELSFRGVLYSITVSVAQNSTLRVDLEQLTDASRWHGEFACACETYGQATLYWNLDIRMKQHCEFLLISSSRDAALPTQMWKISQQRQAASRSLLFLCGCSLVRCGAPPNPSQWTY